LHHLPFGRIQQRIGLRRPEQHSVPRGNLERASGQELLHLDREAVPGQHALENPKRILSLPVEPRLQLAVVAKSQRMKRDFSPIPTGSSAAASRFGLES
jgi:hypothetical protein